MTTTDFKKQMKQALDTVDAGKPLFVTRGGKIYKVLRAN
jgi:hypothetical protein